MIFRRRQVGALWTFVALLPISAVVLCGMYSCRHLFASQESTLRITLENPLIVGLLVVAIPAILSGVIKVLRRPLVVQWPVALTPLGRHESNRSIIESRRLDTVFEFDDTSKQVREDGWEANAAGVCSESIATFKGPLRERFSVAAQIKPISREPESSYWRIGFRMYEDNGDERIVLHIDNHNLVVARFRGKKVLSVPHVSLFENRWNLLALEVGLAEEMSERYVVGHINGQSYWVGSLPQGGPLSRLEIAIWSDNRRHHRARIRDVSVMTALP